jgi:pSer/pThr/pTyr-binding forkhead associated (FHA) protein/tetratricopeptide (TPR) repeat protein
LRGSSDQVFIIVRAPNGDVREFPIGEIAVVIGRDESADIRVEDRKVSRRHAAFKVMDGQPWVEDLGSINGIKLNGKKVSERAMMLAGDVVTVGGYEVSVKPSVRSSRPRSASGPPLDPTPILPRPKSSFGARPRNDTQAAKMTLIGQSRPVDARKFKLGFGENIVGRLEDCAVPILDGSVSRQHARIVIRPDKATVTDLASSNGTFLNDTRIDNGELSDGDRVRFGNVQFVVALSAEIPGREAPIEPSKYATSPQKRSMRGEVLIAVGAVVLIAALGILYVSMKQADRMRSLFSRSTPQVEVDAGLAAEGVATPDGGFLVEVQPPPKEDTLEPSTSETVAVGAPTGSGGAGEVASVPVSVVLKTSTSPFGKRDPSGRPLDLPSVDTSFDFDGFVRQKLEEAIALESSGRLAEVRAVIGELLDRDPINQDALQMRRRVDLLERGQKAIADGDVFRGQGRLLRALETYAKVPEGAPNAEEARARIAQLKPVAVKRELGRVERDIKKKKSWPRAHKRLRVILELEPDNVLAKGAISDLEGKMREANIAFQPYTPAPTAPQQPTPTPTPVAENTTKKEPLEEKDPPPASSRREEIAKRWEDRGLQRIVQTYADGDISAAIKRTEASMKKAKPPKKTIAKGLLTSLKKLQTKYERVRSEVANDPAQAWAHLMEFQKIELEILPEGVKSYLVTELEETIAEAFAERGAALYEQERFELAFQQWDSGFKLNASNAKIIEGLKKLESKAEKWSEEAELAAQRGQPDACDRWRRITRMTRGDTEPHKKARERLARSCAS